MNSTQCCSTDLKIKKDAVMPKTENAKGKKRQIKINLKNKDCIETEKKTKGLIRLELKEKPKIEIRKLREVNKHIDNARMILLNSNATPIRGYAGIGYKCCFCSEQFVEASNLKKHTIETHNDNVKSTFMKCNKGMSSYIVKLDITSLNCKLCKAEIETLEDLIEHLITIHKKSYNTDAKNHIIPFKFDTETLKCVVCKKDFNNFKILQEHMNVHYRNNVCEVCGRGFVNNRMLTSHSYRHLTGTFQCSYCSKVYDTKVKQREHERAVHINLHMRNKCGYCGERFADYRKKKQHEVKMHGAKQPVFKCEVCGKDFSHQLTLSVHKKKYHLSERRCPK